MLWMASFGCASLGVFAGKYVQLVSIGIHYSGMKSSFFVCVEEGGGCVRRRREMIFCRF